MYQAAAVPRTSGTQHGEWERRRGEPRSGGGSCPPWRWCRPPGGHPQRHPAMGLALSVACLPTTAAATAATAAVTTRGGGVAAADTAAVGRTRAPAGPLQLWRRRRGSRSTRPLFLLVMTPPLARRHQPHRCRRRCGPRFAWGSPRLAAAGSSPLARGGGGWRIVARHSTGRQRRARTTATTALSVSVRSLCLALVERDCQSMSSTSFCSSRPRGHHPDGHPAFPALQS